MNQPVLGIDIGGSALKFGPVDTTTGQLTAPAQSLSLPQPATATALLHSVRECRSIFSATNSFGVGFPGVVKNGVVSFAPHLDESLVGHDWLVDLKTLTELPVALLNDADAAAIAETRFGAGSQNGTVLLLTLGTGIGSALIRDGLLVPNTEFGHLMLGNTEAEDLAAASVRIRENLSWTEYSAHLNRFLLEMERLVNPDLIIIGGGISENFGRLAAGLELNVEVLPATLGNNAGLVGAALAASS